MSWLSGLSATDNPCFAAKARVCALLKCPNGKRVIQLVLPGRERVGLVAIGIASHVQLGAI